MTRHTKARIALVVSTIGFVQASRQQERAESARDEAEQARTAETDQRLLAEEAKDQAEAERDRAIAAERLAESRRAEAEEVTDFLRDMLASVDPAKAQGRQITVKEVLDKAAAHIEDEFPDHPLVEATLRSTIGVTYRALGRYGTAEQHLRAALKLRRQELGTEAAEVGDALRELALLLWAQGDLDRAERSFREALVLCHT